MERVLTQLDQFFRKQDLSNESGPHLDANISSEVFF